jgi:hypothetical protein
MLFMLIVKASSHSENGARPNERLNTLMREYNEKLVEANVRVMAKGLHPTSEAIRFHFVNENEAPLLSEGPFLPAKDQVAGFFLLEVASKEEAISWAKLCPDPQGKGEGLIELREVYA